MSLRTIIQNACDRMGLPRPATVVGNLDQTVRVLLGLAQVEGKELARRREWQALTVDATFTSVSSEQQDATAIPADFDRFIEDSFWNRTRRRPLSGPLRPEEWQSLKATVAPAVVDVFRLRGGRIHILPVPSAGDTYAYSYVSKNWCSSDLAVPQDRWASDTDAAILDEELHTLGVVWRFMQSRGLDYAEDYRRYQEQVFAAGARDGGKRRLNLASESAFSARQPAGDWTVSP